MKIRFIGIDPGKDGAISCLDEVGRAVHCSVSPRLGEKEFDIIGMAKLLHSYTSDCDFFVIGLEDIHATTVGGNTGTFTMGRGKGLWEGIISMYSLAVPGKFRLILPTPGRWQKLVWEDTYIQYEKKPGNKSKTVNTKATSLLTCTHLFQGFDLRKSSRARNPHDGIVDSLLIAEYCRRKYYQEIK